MLSTYLSIISHLILQNWMAFTALKVGNFTLTKTVMLNNPSSKFHYSNHAYCQVSFKVSFMTWVTKSFFFWYQSFFFPEVDNHSILKVNRLVSVKGPLSKKVVL